MRVCSNWRALVAALCAAAALAGCGASPAPGLSSAASKAAEQQLKLRYLQALVRKRPEHWRARIRLASLYTAAEQHREAFASLREAAAISPRNVGLHAALGEAADTVGYSDWVFYSWQQVARLAPGDPLARLRLAQLYRELGWMKDAAAQLAAAERFAPGSLELLKEQASLSAAAGSPAQTRRWAQQMVQKYPYSPYGYSLLADLAAGAKRWREAVDYGKLAIARAPKEPTFLIRQAQYEMLRSDAPDPQAALLYLEQARRLSPDDPDLHYWTGFGLRLSGRSEEALQEFEAAYRQAPQRQGLGINLAELYRQSGRTAEADRIVRDYKQREQAEQHRRAVATRVWVQPLSREAHVEMARVHLQAGEPGLALIELLAARRLDPARRTDEATLREALRKQERDPSSLAPL
ncbi:MAG TPA: tetratricopeptide repeat protein [Armatimonadota bacterium]|nr:tetratricopeptide repeat protein [Armatimonadota bacterium]